MPLVQCGPAQNCRGTTDPIANLSAEGPDVPKCFRHAFTEQSNYTCEFDLSLCDAYAALGIDIGIFCNPPNSIINGTNPPLPIIYSSNAQTCADSCGQTYTVVAGTFVATTQAQADAQAFQFACTLAAMLCLGPLPTIYTNTEQSCSVLCPDGSTFTFTAPTGISSALSQAQANADAYAFACGMASLLCSGLPPVATQEDAGVPRQQPASPLWANTAQACSANCPGGGSYTYVVPGGTYLAESRAVANGIALSAACRLAQLQQACLSSLPTIACKDEFFAEFLSASGLTAPITYTLASGSFPPGITLDSNGLVSGVATTAGSYSFSIRATGSEGTYTQRTYTLGVVQITPDFLPDAAAGTPYATAISVIGMTNPTWGLVGNLPPGLTLNPNTGVIAGTPSGSAAIYLFAINVSNGVDVCQKSYSLEVTSDCVNWNNLLWGVPIVTGLDGSNGYTWTPAPAATGKDFHGTIFTSHMQNHPITVTAIAQVAFSSATDCNCNIHIDGTQSAPPISQIRLHVSRDDIIGPGSILLLTGHITLSGIQDHPFTAPAGNYNIVVNIDMEENSAIALPANFDVVGEFQNL